LETKKDVMKKAVLVSRWVLLVAVPALIVAFWLCVVREGACLATFACTSGAVIGLTRLAPCHKRTVALLMFGLGISFSLEILTLAPVQPYAGVFYIQWSGEWKPSAGGVIGSVIGLLVARKFQDKPVRQE